jgi:Tfp pilus assembly protein PilZ
VKDLLERFSSDRRLAPRHRIQTRLRVRVSGSKHEERRAKSENLSRGGVFFATDLELEMGAKVELLLKMPQEITGVEASEWLCTGHVVRLERIKSPRGAMGVGVKFDCYEVSQAVQMDRSPASPLKVGNLRRTSRSRDEAYE